MNRIMIAGVLAAMGWAQAQAQVVYETIADNIGVTPISLQQQYQAGGAFAQSFQAGSNLSSIGDGDGNGQLLYTFRINLVPYTEIIDFISGQTAYSPTDFSVGLYGDASGNPGTLHPSAYSVTETVASPGVQSFSFQSGPIFQTGINYWVRISARPANSTAPIIDMAGVYGTTSTGSTGIGSFGVSKYFDGNSWDNSDRYIMSIKVESVPEPGSAGLLMLGLGCWLAKRRRCGRY